MDPFSDNDSYCPSHRAGTRVTLFYVELIAVEFRQ